MAPIFQISVRQLASRWRMLLIVLMAALPVGLALAVRALSSAGPARGATVDVFFDGMIVGAIMPIVTMTLATAAFGNELEDRTLNYLVLKPVSRTLIVLPKVLAAVALGGPLLIASSVGMTLLLFDGDVGAMVAVGVAVLVGLLAYASIFSWLGLLTKSALALALIYVLLWEGLVSTFLGGVRYLSVRAYTLAIMYELDKGAFDEFDGRVIEFPAAVAGAAGVTVVFFWLAVRRLRRMDVP